MAYDGLLTKFPKEIKIFIAVFVVILSVGYFTGLLFINQTDSTSPAGIEENYLGNEADEDATVMKFKKGAREMLTIVHTHVLSMSFIFFLLGGLVWITKAPKKWKLFLTIEPFLSVVFTFGGIYLMWSGISWFKYVVIFSGILMTLTFIASATLVLWQCLKPQSP
ncbi:hypothetical protein [Flagellimonas zhangzhouensis]|uniref:Uncharacterized protein n=1 Tax=Flagellimonas zhangzhouensis TaxID=1073328 RepID=A0A1H2QW64_9FLAO|nr:hypothetical protein [Allomuricauda zhangzhouensis]SDQ57354.1 hypothetical protein SAMN05216294_1737 [Allomuricauda zhangzhouensis]SDW11417.1 hypothetical protein SAMN04487892_0389 [Allomuricauda zhangzhouensis]